jgi:Ni/Co efflux regulator RcnB
MRKLSLTLLAASTMLVAGIAAAQPGPGARPGATWRGGAGQVQMRAPHVQMRGQMPRGNVRMHGGGQVRTGGGLRAHSGGSWGRHRWGQHPGRNWRHQRLRRGGSIHSFWFAPQFYVGNWQAYGFYAPGEDQRWVRYYDDAYLIDGGGRVIDERYGVDWRSRGEDWDDYDGIPGYRGDWSERGDEEGYAEEEYSESGEHHGDRREHHVEMRRHGGHGPMMPPPGYGPPPGHGGSTHVYGGGYGYGMYAYPIVIETITTTGSSGYTEEIVEEYVEVTRQRRRAHRPRRARCACTPPRPAVRRPAPRPAPPRPRPGERG